MDRNHARGNSYTLTKGQNWHEFRKDSISSNNPGSLFAKMNFFEWGLISKLGIFLNVGIKNDIICSIS